MGAACPARLARAGRGGLRAGGRRVRRAAVRPDPSGGGDDAAVVGRRAHLARDRLAGRRPGGRQPGEQAGVAGRRRHGLVRDSPGDDELRDLPVVRQDPPRHRRHDRVPRAARGRGGRRAAAVRPGLGGAGRGGRAAAGPGLERAPGPGRRGVRAGLRRGLGRLHPAEPGHWAAFLRHLGPGDRDVRGGRHSHGAGGGAGRAGDVPAVPAGGRGRDRAAVLGDPLLAGVRGAAAGAGPGVRGVDEHAARGGGADRPGHARPAAERGGVGGHLLRGRGQRRRGARRRARGSPGVTMGACLPGLPALRPRSCGRPRPPCAGSRWPR